MNILDYRIISDDVHCWEQGYFLRLDILDLSSQFVQSIIQIWLA